MLVNFNKIQEHTYSGMNKGTGTISAKMYMDKDCKIIPCTIHAGGSIGIHKHETSDDINYVLSGNGKQFVTDKKKSYYLACVIYAGKILNTALSIQVIII